MKFISLFLGILWISLGILIRSGSIQLPVWKNKGSLQPFCTNIGMMIQLCGMIFLLAGLSERFQDTYFTWDLTAWALAAVLDAVWILHKAYFLCE